MTIAIIFIILILIGACISTVMLGGRSDENYSGAHKANTYRLTAIYAVVILASLAALGWYISTL